jgi:histidinol-phosphate aminotransferase
MCTVDFNLNKLIRKNIANLTPYSSARDEFSGSASVYLDANENPFDNGVNRYPDPLQRVLKSRLSELKGVPADQMILGNGSDEVIDLLFRAFCEPNQDNVIICTPTYGMYEVAANVNAVTIKEVLLDDDFQPDVDAVLKACDSNTRMLILCSPNNPTANVYEEERIQFLLNNFKGIVMLDEAYIDFAPGKTFTQKLIEYPNLVILQTLSKAWGMAGIRLGIGMASKAIVEILNRIKPPYNVNVLSQQKALELLKQEELYSSQVNTILEERGKLIDFLKKLNCVERVYATDSNFVLVKVSSAPELYEYLQTVGIIIRDRSKVVKLENCVRISIGTLEENQNLMQKLIAYDTLKL